MIEVASEPAVWYSPAVPRRVENPLDRIAAELMPALGNRKASA